MRITSLPARMLFLLLIIAFTAPGCKKLYDYIASNPSGEYKDCRIQKLTAYSRPFYDTTHTDTTFYIFTYNRLGDPVSITNNRVGTGNPNYSFRYDKYNRLSQCIRPYATYTGYEQWSKYLYDDKGRIVSDTVWAFGLMSGGEGLPSDLWGVETYTYDSKGRITQVAFVNRSYGAIRPPTYINYTYDASGNIAGRAHDDKLNPAHLSSVFMFTWRDYSINNPYPALQYNDHGLPTFIDHSDVPIPLFNAWGTSFRMEYLCH